MSVATEQAPSITREAHGVIFTAQGTFSAYHEAVHFLKQVGFSLGPMQRGAPIAVMFGDYRVSKWRNLSRAERERTHATLSGNFREGPLTFELLPAAPPAAALALHDALDGIFPEAEQSA